MSHVCAVIDITAGGTPCPTPADQHLTQGCIHEHIRDIHACATHTGRLTSGVIVCRACLESPRPHHCQLTARMIP